MKEPEVKHLVKEWLQDQNKGCFVEIVKSPVDLKVSEYGKGNQPVWLVEVKGDQCNPHWREHFFRGLGQLTSARSRYLEAKISLALTSYREYVSLVEEHKATFEYLQASVIWVYNKQIYFADYKSPQFPCPQCGEGIAAIRRHVWSGELMCPHCESPLRC